MGTLLRLLFVTLLAGCISPGAWLAVSLRHLPAQSTSLRVTLQLQGSTETSVQRLSRPFRENPMEVDVPRAWRGRQLTLDVVALDDEQREIGEGRAAVELPRWLQRPVSAFKRARGWSRLEEGWRLRRTDRPVEVAVELANFPARWPVSISETGDVPLQVESDAPTIKCPQRAPCELMLTPGTRVSVRAQSDPAITFWSGPCEKNRGDTCSFTVKEPANISVSFARPVCRRGLCWHNPLPQGNPLSALWGSARTDVWAAGAVGTLMHFDGQLWEGVESGTMASLFGLWGSGPRDVWACGSGGVLLHYDGEKWSAFDSGTGQDLYGISGNSQSSIWGVGKGGVTLHYDGKQWRTIPSGVRQDLRAVWILDEQNAWAVGDSGTLLHFDGQHWQARPSGTTANLLGVWGRSPNELWAFTSEGAHRLGSKKLPRYVGAAEIAIRTVSPKEAWVLDAKGRMRRIEDPRPAHWVTASDMASGFNLSAVSAAWMSDPADVWIAGTQGTLHHFDGRRWSVVHGNILGGNELSGVRGRSASDAWALGWAPAHWDGEAWTLIERGWQREQPKRWRNYLELLLFGARPLRLNPNIWMGGELSGLHAPRQVFASGPDDVWRLGFGLRHFDGENWETSPTPGERSGNAIWGSSASDIWVVGETGRILHFDGKTWHQTLPSPAGSAALHAIWGSHPGDIWAAGAHGLLLHYDGQIWRAVPSGSKHVLYDVWGFDTNDVWAVGERGTLLHYQGATWSPAWSGTLTPWRLTGVWGSRPGDLWITGEHGVLIRLQTDGHAPEQPSGVR